MTSLLNGQELLEELCELQSDLEDWVEDEEFRLDYESKWDDESDWFDPEVETYSSTNSVYMWWGKDKRDWCIYRYEGYKSRSGVGMDDSEQNSLEHQFVSISDDGESKFREWVSKAYPNELKEIDG